MNEVVRVELPIPGRAKADHYFLRGLLHCHPCDEPLVPTFSSSGQRLYGCPGSRCPRPWLPAGQIEEQIWARFAALNEQAARRVSAGQRQEALAAVLNRITVGVRVDDLEYDWRD